MRKVFNFAIEMDGIDQFYIQEVKKPEVEIGAVLHGGANHDIKTAGGITVPDAELTKVRRAEVGESWAWDWMQQAQDMNAGLGGIEADYKRNVIFKELSPDGFVLNSWLWEGAWIRKTSDSNYKRGNKSENVIETVIMSVDRVRKLS